MAEVPSRRWTYGVVRCVHSVRLADRHTVPLTPSMAYVDSKLRVLSKGMVVCVCVRVVDAQEISRTVGD